MVAHRLTQALTMGKFPLPPNNLYFVSKYIYRCASLRLVTQDLHLPLLMKVSRLWWTQLIPEDKCICVTQDLVKMVALQGAVNTIVTMYILDVILIVKCNSKLSTLEFDSKIL